MRANGFLGGHSESYRVWIADDNDLKVSRLPHTGGTIDWNMFQVVQGGGTITVAYDESYKWNNSRLLVEYVARLGQNTITYPLMVPIVTNCVPDKRGNLMTLTVADKCKILQDDRVDESVSYPVGTRVVQAVIDQVNAAGEISVVVEESDETLRTAMSWGAGTSRLTIINDLLASINYLPMWVMGNGTFYSRPSTANTDPIHSFVAGPECIASEEVSDSLDMSDIPNKIVCISTTDGETEPLIGVAVNDDPDSDWSTADTGRGRVITRVIEDVEATSQEVIDQIARDYLNSSSQVTWRQTVQHLRAQLWIRDRVTGVDGQEAQIVEMSQELTAGSLTSSVLRRLDRLVGTDAPVDTEETP